MTYQMTIWMFRRHDDFHSAAPIVEKPCNCTLPAHQTKWGIIPSPNSGETYPPVPPPAPTPMIQPLVQWFLVLQEFGALQTLLVKHNRRLKQRAFIATECSYRELGDRKSPSVVQGQSGGGLGDEVPQKLKGVRWGCPLPTGVSGSGLGGGCAPFPDFLKFLSENGEF